MGEGAALSPQVLQAQLDTLRQGQESILSSCAFTEQALHHGTATEVLLVKKQMSERLSELASREFPEHPHENAQLDFVVETEGVRKSILNLGVLITTSATAHKTVATGEGLRHAVVGQPSSLSVTTKDKDGELVRSGSASLRFQVTAPDGGTAEAEVQDNKNGTYELLYTPRAEGDFLLSILLYGQPIRGSPFRVRAVKASDVPPSPDDVKRRVKSPSSGHIRQKAVRRPSSMYSSGKKKENPIEDELIFRVGERRRGGPRVGGGVLGQWGVTGAPRGRQGVSGAAGAPQGGWGVPGAAGAPWGGGGPGDGGGSQWQWGVPRGRWRVLGAAGAPSGNGGSPGWWVLPGASGGPRGGGSSLVWQGVPGAAGGPSGNGGTLGWAGGPRLSGAGGFPLTAPLRHRKPWPGEGGVHQPPGHLHLQQRPHRGGRQQ